MEEIKAFVKQSPLAILIVVILLAATSSLKAQQTQGSVIPVSPRKLGEKPSASTSPTIQKGTVEGALIDGQPAIKFTDKSGSSVIVLLTGQGSEESFIIPITHIKTFHTCKGLLYVTRDRIAYDPIGDKAHAFNVARSDVEVKNSMYFKVSGKDFKFLIEFNDGYIGRLAKPVHDFLNLILSNFESATQEVKQLNAQQNNVTSPSPANGGQVNVEDVSKVASNYDRFTDKTTVQIQRTLIFSHDSNMMINYSIGEFWLLAGYEYSGQQKVKPNFVALGFSAMEATDHTEFRNPANRNLILIVDGERLPLGMMSEQLFFIRRVGNEERLEIAIPYNAFAKIANAKRVEGRVGNIEFVLQEKHLAVLRALIADFSSTSQIAR